MVKRLRKGLALAAIVGPITGILATIANRASRSISAPRKPDFISLPRQPLTGPELLSRAEDLVLEALRSEPKVGLTNAEVGERTGLNPPLSQRSGEVTRTILNSLVERAIVSKDGQHYIAAPR